LCKYPPAPGILTELQHDKSHLLYTPILYIKYKGIKAWFTLAIDNLHVRLIFYLGGKKVNSRKELIKISKIAKFGCEMW
jgi:hypothetical protein